MAENVGGLSSSNDGQAFKDILKDLEIATVKTVDEVLKIALVKELKPIEWIEVENLPKTKGGEKPSTSPH